MYPGPGPGGRPGLRGDQGRPPGLCAACLILGLPPQSAIRAQHGFNSASHGLLTASVGATARTTWQWTSPSVRSLAMHLLHQPCAVEDDCRRLAETAGAPDFRAAAALAQ